MRSGRVWSQEKEQKDPEAFTQTSVRLRNKILDQAHKLAAAEGVSFAHLVAQLIEERAGRRADAPAQADATTRAKDAAQVVLSEMLPGLDRLPSQSETAA
jgi:hypothetical protein